MGDNNTTMYIILVIIILIGAYFASSPPHKENFIVQSIKEKLVVVDPNFDKLDIRESNSSYTEDKSIIYLCLRDENGQVYPMNTIIYVTLHEIAHLLNRDDYGHTEKFHKVFDDLLCKAADVGIYDPSQPHGNLYCGVDITDIKMPKCRL